MPRGLSAASSSVEDDQYLREALSDLVEAAASRSALRPMKWRRSGSLPAAVFLDKSIPRLDGAGVLAVMRSDPELASIPVVWMSGDPGYPATVARHLLKPFDPEVLVSILGEVCEVTASAFG
jgi:CheY-like chemotaxis protein